ncbi:MAG TPA: hypothetical protein VJV05_02640 [Pyrinomonadaceae bacterium]|nr:hypothetical protein [Pyrinomonadaceae bacterium]
MFTRVCFATSLTFLLATCFAAQSPPPSPVTKEAIEDPVLLRWKISLTALAQDAKTVFPEERRPYAMVEVANALWEIDRSAARTSYISALDTSLALRRQDKKHKDLISYVLSAAAKLDLGLVKDLNKRLLEEEKNDEAVSETALDLLEENPEAAAQLIEAMAPGGLKNGTAAELILYLANKDLRLSDRVFSVCLAKAAADQNVDLSSIVTLAGYAFGRREYYLVTPKGGFSGRNMPPVPGLSARQHFVKAFLDLASRRLSLAIERRDQAVGGDVTALNYPILFTSEYLLPEVARVSPASLPGWQQLHDRAIVGATPEQTQNIAGFIDKIQQARLRLETYANPNGRDLEADLRLNDVEAMVGTCRRDAVYSNAAMVFAGRKDFKRASELAGKIEDLKQSDIVKDGIAIGVAEASIEEGKVDEAAKLVSKIASLEHKTRLSIELVRAMSKNRARETAIAVNDALKLIDKVAEPWNRAGFLFALAAIVFKDDTAEGQSILMNAIKNLNRVAPADVKEFEILFKIPLSCPGEEISWYGGIETLSNSNVLDSLTVFAALNPDEANRTAEEIGDRVTRIRALAVISRQALKDLRRDAKRTERVGER